MYEGNPGEIDFGSSYRESTAKVINKATLLFKIKKKKTADTETSKKPLSIENYSLRCSRPTHWSKPFKYDADMGNC